MVVYASNFVSPLTSGQIAYRAYLQSWRWRFILRPVRVWFDGGKCRLCNSAEFLEVHHRSYTHCGGNFLLEFLDLTTVCHADHSAYHRRGK